MQNKRREKHAGQKKTKGFIHCAFDVGPGIDDVYTSALVTSGADTKQNYFINA